MIFIFQNNFLSKNNSSYPGTKSKGDFINFGDHGQLITSLCFKCGFSPRLEQNWTPTFLITFLASWGLKRDISVENSLQ